MVKSARRREDLIQMVIIDMNQRVRLHRADWRSLIVVVQVEGGGRMRVSLYTRRSCPETRHMLSYD